MSALEQEAKPILTPMIKGHRLSLTRRDQTILANWAVKTMMMFQWTHTYGRGVPDSHAPYLHENREPPPATWIWLGGFAELAPDGRIYAPSLSYYDHHLLHVGTPDPPIASDDSNGYVSTLTIGRLVFQVLGADEDRTAEPLEGLFRHPFGAETVIGIWPIQASLVQWPPQYQLNEQGLEALCAVFPDD